MRVDLVHLCLVLRMLVGAATPPEPLYKGVTPRGLPSSELDPWRFAPGEKNEEDEDEENLWERSGYFEGDIMTIGGQGLKNILLKEEARWPNNTLPYHIEEDEFTDDELEVIKGALAEYEQKTCVHMRPFKEGDPAWVHVRGRHSGCWSFVGRHVGGQELNLHTPGCVRHGIVIHEFFHALGAFHQQSADDRDDYVTIHWENIRPGRENNFRKYSPSSVTSFGLTYDYESVMHYSGKAFTKNGKPTIVPKDTTAKIGQRKGLSKLDVDKLEAMYPCYKENDFFTKLWSPFSTFY